jgi:hypothetical protein
VGTDVPPSTRCSSESDSQGCSGAEAWGQVFIHIPKYVSHLGWVGLWLDTPQVDCAEIEAILVGAYRLTAPKKLIAELNARQNA